MHFYLCSNISIRQPPFVPRQVQAGQLFFLKLEGKQEHSHSFSLSFSLAEPPWSVWDKALFHGPSTVVATASWGLDGSLTSWLQSLSAVILEPKERKFVSVSTFFPIFAMKGPNAMILAFWMLGWLNPNSALAGLPPWARYWASLSSSLVEVGVLVTPTQKVFWVLRLMHVDGLAGCHAYSKPLYFYLCYYFSGWRVKSSQFSKNSGKCILI